MPSAHAGADLETHLHAQSAHSDVRPKPAHEGPFTRQVTCPRTHHTLPACLRRAQQDGVLHAHPHRQLVFALACTQPAPARISVVEAVPCLSRFPSRQNERVLLSAKTGIDPGSVPGVLQIFSRRSGQRTGGPSLQEESCCALSESSAPAQPTGPAHHKSAVKLLCA